MFNRRGKRPPPTSCVDKPQRGGIIAIHQLHVVDWRTSLSDRAFLLLNYVEQPDKGHCISILRPKLSKVLFADLVFPSSSAPWHDPPSPCPLVSTMYPFPTPAFSSPLSMPHAARRSSRDEPAPHASVLQIILHAPRPRNAARTIADICQSISRWKSASDAPAVDVTR